MKKLGLIILCIILTALTSCKSQPIKIGFVGSITGVNSELSISGMYGVQMAVEEINSKGGIKGRNIELIIKDDKNNPKTALEVDKQLVEENCDVIVGHFTSGVISEVVPYINSQKKLLLSPTISTDVLNDKDDYFIRACPVVDRQSEALFKLLVKDGKKNVLIVYNTENKAYAENFHNDIVKLNNIAKSFNVTSLPFSKKTPLLDEKNFEKIKSANPDAIVIIAASDDTANFCQNLEKRNINAQKYLSTWAMTNDLFSHAGKTIEQAKGVNFIDLNSKEKMYIEFKNKFIKKYGISPDFSAVYSYESIYILKQSMEGAKDFSSDKIKRELLAIKTFRGLQGEISINKYGDCIRKTYIYRIENKNIIAEVLNEK